MKKYCILLTLTLAGCSYMSNFIKPETYTEYETSSDPKTFYTDKLKCETTYSVYSFFGGKENGNIYKDGPAKDCTLSKGYKVNNKFTTKQEIEKTELNTEQKTLSSRIGDFFKDLFSKKS